MKSISIKGSKRESVGKKATKALRNAGQVPCVIYGGDQPMHFSAPELAFKGLVYTPDAHTVDIELEGTTYRAILQDIQFHPVTDRIVHVDFYQIFDDKEVTMIIPVRFIGSSKGVLNGGVLRKNNRTLRIKALPDNLPDFVEANITDLRIGSKLYVTALENEAYKFMHPDNTVVCQVRTSRNAVDLDDEDEDEDGETTEATETSDVAAVKE
ncbi:50S ribosomal protein L25/general stress protein Ctc [uncultured Dokdonia sp.]|uniref:50S ribosomal protein L25/general stress protein Ctc n=1 Tax=uncultured Dokdonia sp. TaxID=575653 RepID=UPI00260598FC|nr:50S ribosomal protein L25/general stress protein Ctc [uncultured Dokdonia sp.]